MEEYDVICEEIKIFYKKNDINTCIGNLKRIIKQTPLKKLVVDHHLLRDLNWADYVIGLDKVRDGVQILSAAGYLGTKEDILEARREELYNKSTSE